MTRFLLDAQLSRRLARHLAEAGYPASHVFDHLDPDADDITIAALANRMEACIITKDADFAELARRRVLQQTLVWLRVPNINNGLLWARMDRALPDIVSAVRGKSRIVEVF